MEDYKMLHELIRMHTVRMGFYEERMLEVNEIDHCLAMLFEEMKDDSKRFHRLLVEILENVGEMPEKQSRPVRKRHQWKRTLRNLFFTADRASILSGCEFLEEAIQSTYRAAIDADTMNDETKRLVIGQQHALRISAENIRFLITSNRAQLSVPFEWSGAIDHHLIL